MILGLFGIHWVMPCNVLDLWARWQGHLSDHQNMVVWKIVALVISQIEVVGEVVIGGSSRRYQWKKKKSKEAAG